MDEADQARRAARRRPVRERVVIGSPAHGPEDLGLSERCMLGFNAGRPMLPSAYNNNIQILQTPDHVVIFNEMVHDARIVPPRRRAARARRRPAMAGDSRGRWEGDTLVVESTNFTHKTGSFYTIARSYGSGRTTRLIERFTREAAVGCATNSRSTIPATFTQPFTAMIPMTRTDAPLFEYGLSRGQLRHDQPAGRRPRAGTGGRRRGTLMRLIQSRCPSGQQPVVKPRVASRAARRPPDKA